MQITAVISAHNDNSKAYNLTAVVASLHSPTDYSMYVQNFTHMVRTPGPAAAQRAATAADPLEHSRLASRVTPCVCLQSILGRPRPQHDAEAMLRPSPRRRCTSRRCSPTRSAQLSTSSACRPRCPPATSSWQCTSCTRTPQAAISRTWPLTGPLMWWRSQASLTGEPSSCTS
jgi:hypothetical protein